jgi:transketolase
LKERYDSSERNMRILTEEEALDLKRTALNVRRNVLRMIKAGKSGHIGGALSVVDILTVLYFKIMKVDPGDPKWIERDRFVLSAGHKCLALYAVLAEKGFFKKEILDTYGSLGSILPGHPDMHKIQGIESNTGALGHGLSIAGGMGLGLKLDSTPSKVYVIMGDGELAEGSNWEAAAAISHHKLDNITVFVDRNTLQISGRTTDVMSYEPLARRWESFGWIVREIEGHDIAQIVKNSTAVPFEKGKPSVIIANTVKSKGLSFAEDKADYHYWKATEDTIAAAEKDLSGIERSLNL